MSTSEVVSLLVALSAAVCILFTVVIAKEWVDEEYRYIHAVVRVLATSGTSTLAPPPEMPYWWSEWQRSAVELALDDAVTAIGVTVAKAKEERARCVQIVRQATDPDGPPTADELRRALDAEEN